MNLYSVSDNSCDWCCYIFETTRNKAKMRCAKHFFFDYIDARCKLLKRGVNVPEPMIVDDEDCPGYDVVLKCGYKFLQED